jgi:hypothetical protein
MDILYRCLLTAPLAIALAFAAPAQNGPPGSAPTPVVDPIEAAPTLTGKERLGRKWTDEQRVDNCKVPVDKRGPKSRAASCAPASPGF